MRAANPISSSNMSKNVKKQEKSVISVITQNPLYPDCPESWCYRLGVFWSVRDLRVHKCTRSSDATCCASMAVKTCIFSPGATTSKIWPPGAPKLGAELIFLCRRWDAPLTGTRLLYAHLQFRPQKC